MRQKNGSESLSKTMAMIEMRWRAAAHNHLCGEIGVGLGFTH
jgi:hypothetical protein